MLKAKKHDKIRCPKCGIDAGYFGEDVETSGIVKDIVLYDAVTEADHMNGFRRLCKNKQCEEATVAQLFLSTSNETRWKVFTKERGWVE